VTRASFSGVFLLNRSNPLPYTPFASLPWPPLTRTCSRLLPDLVLAPIMAGDATVSRLPDFSFFVLALDQPGLFRSPPSLLLFLYLPSPGPRVCAPSGSACLFFVGFFPRELVHPVWRFHPLSSDNSFGLRSISVLLIPLPFLFYSLSFSRTFFFNMFS